ncbi:putative membrane protein [Tamilnaduibacter salinus]|uniref:Putative membrane protein n=1 Tax=Tamilnaduibacter salinus TaxID=1484056 RepID=A0A2A2I3W0_9GAMM|nr:DUF2061 domain-containing protein [Tamilnaduibacter salinus]PAV25723.1 hypothetical protein CF392_09335 [Tamilnaduibacter salinus]PVY76479.1 putative membrane protein [Tamilnaduibacter salinus]
MSVLLQFIHHHGSQGDQSLVKTITFACTHFTVAFTVAYLLTGDIIIGSLLAMIEPAINTIAYFFHEKLWSRSGGTEDGAVKVVDPADVRPPEGCPCYPAADGMNA